MKILFSHFPLETFPMLPPVCIYVCLYALTKRKCDKKNFFPSLALSLLRGDDEEENFAPAEILQRTNSRQALVD